MDPAALTHWKHLFTPMTSVKAIPPKWVVPHLLVPGLNLMVGAPKTFKSFLVLNIIASILDNKPVGGDRRKVGMKKGSIAYYAAEQSHGSLKDIYEKRVLRQKMGERTSWDFILPKDVWSWQLDAEEPGPYDFVSFVTEWKPMVLVLDPLVYFHQYDENDPQMVRPLVPLRKAMLAYGGSLVVVHHARKESAQQAAGGSATSGADWNKVRGTSALFAMADAGLMLTKGKKAGTIQIDSIFKDHPAEAWLWRPAIDGVKAPPPKNPK